MPYSLSNPPSVIKDMPAKYKHIWIAAFNSAYKQYGKDEEKCFAVAWAAVAKAGYKKKEVSMPVTKDGYKVVRECTLLEFESIVSEENVVRGVTVIKAGKSLNRRNYSETVLARDYSVFENCLSYFGHLDPLEQSDPTKVCGTIKSVRYDQASKSVKGDLHYDEASKPMIEKAERLKDRVGLSISTALDGKYIYGDDPYFEVTQLIKTKFTSVDVVVNPAAGGKVFESAIDMEEIMDPNEIVKGMTIEQLLEARPDMKEHFATESEAAKKAAEAEASKKEPLKVINEAELRESVVKDLTEKFAREAAVNAVIDGANLPKDVVEHLKSKCVGPEFTVDVVQKEVDIFKSLAAKASESIQVGRITIGLEPQDKRQIAMDCLFGVPPKDKQGIKPFRGIREAYISFTGDVDVTGELARESLYSTDLVNALGVSMNKKLIEDYKAQDYGWRLFCTTGSAPDFKTQNRIRIGYLGDISQIAGPGGVDVPTYDELANYTDEQATFAIRQFGNKFTLSRKLIINDDMDTIIKVTGRLGRAANRTLAKLVFGMLETGNGASIYTVDGLAFFALTATRAGVFSDATGNLGAAALAAEAIQARMLIMEQAMEPNSGENIGLQVRPDNTVLITHSSQRWVADGINHAAQATGVAAYAALDGYWGQNNERIVASPLLTTAADWYLAFTKEEIEWMQVNFLQGREEPELFLADNPVVGATFDFDQWTYKLRHEYEALFLDPRGCHKHHI